MLWCRFLHMFQWANQSCFVVPLNSDHCRSSFCRWFTTLVNFAKSVVSVSFLEYWQQSIAGRFLKANVARVPPSGYKLLWVKLSTSVQRFSWRVRNLSWLQVRWSSVSSSRGRVIIDYQWFPLMVEMTVMWFLLAILYRFVCWHLSSLYRLKSYLTFSVGWKNPLSLEFFVDFKPPKRNLV